MMDMDDFLSLLDILSDGLDIRGDVVDTTELTNGNHCITIDTCLTNDTGKYETGIKVDSDEWVIVERYPNKTSATIGHDEWIEKCNTLPIKLLSVQDGRTYIYE